MLKYSNWIVKRVISTTDICLQCVDCLHLHVLHLGRVYVYKLCSGEVHVAVCLKSIPVHSTMSCCMLMDTQ